MRGGSLPVSSPSDLGETLEIGLQHLTLQHQIHVLAVALDLNQAGRFELFDVVRHRRRAHVVILLKRAARARAIRAADLLKQPNAAWLGECARDACELTLAELCIPEAFH